MEAQKPAPKKKFITFKEMSEEVKNSNIQTRPQINGDFETREKNSHERKEPLRK